MCSFPFATRVRITDERTVKKWIKLPVNCVMYEPIAYARFVNIARLWETKSLDNKKYIALSEKIDEIGRMLGGWNGQLTKTQPR